MLQFTFKQFWFPIKFPAEFNQKFPRFDSKVSSKGELKGGLQEKHYFNLHKWEQFWSNFLHLCSLHGEAYNAMLICIIYCINQFSSHFRIELDFHNLPVNILCLSVCYWGFTTVLQVSDQLFKSMKKHCGSESGNEPV